MSYYIKDPDAVLDYTFDWTNWLQSGEQITSNTVAVQSGLTAGTKTASATSVSQFVSGGTIGTTYTVACRITTNQNRTDERTIYISVEHR